MRFIALTAVVVALVASCPSTEPPPDATAFINAQFAASVVCNPTFLEQAEPVFLDAQSRAQIQNAIDAFNRDLANPNVAFSRKDYDECLHAANAKDCLVLNDAGGSCSLVFVGKLGDGKKCAEGLECAPDLDCFQQPNECGVCRAIAKEGTDCTDKNCEAGDFCDPAHSVCAPKPDPTTFNEHDTCSAALGCGGVLSGLACVNNTCQKITVVDDGQVCDVGPSATQYCKDSSTTHVCENSVCTARPVAGDACNAEGECDVTVAACDANATCSSTIGKAGDTCENGNNCQLGFLCKNNVCTALTTTTQPPKCN